MADISSYSPISGNIIGADNRAHNIIDILGGGTPVDDRVYDITQYPPIGGIMIGSDGRAYDIVQIFNAKAVSAYEVAVAGGYAGTQAEWLASLKGTDGKSAFEVAVAGGYSGTQAQWLASLKGADGKSAYEVAVAGGYSGTQAQWLASLVGADGQGVPTGGAIGQALVKSGLPDFVTEWAAVGRTNPNLLINRNFAVNQIGTAIGTAFSANGYITDCWQAWGGNVTLIDGGGVILASGVQLMQRFEIYYVNLFGKTYTLSLKIGGVIKTATITFPSAVAGADTINTLAVAGVGTVGFGFLYTGGTIINDVSRSYVPCIYVVSSAAIQIDDMYLEPGSVSTLAMALPIDYKYDLGNSQRYYEQLSALYWIAATTTSLRPINGFVRKRTIPTHNIPIGDNLLEHAGVAFEHHTITAIDVSYKDAFYSISVGGGTLTKGDLYRFTVPIILNAGM